MHTRCCIGPVCSFLVTQPATEMTSRMSSTYSNFQKGDEHCFCTDHQTWQRPIWVGYHYYQPMNTNDNTATLTAFPDMLAMSRSWLKTPTTVSLAGTNIVCCLDRLDCHTHNKISISISSTACSEYETTSVNWRHQKPCEDCRSVPF